MKIKNKRSGTSRKCTKTESGPFMFFVYFLTLSILSNNYQQTMHLKHYIQNSAKLMKALLNICDLFPKECYVPACNVETMFTLLHNGAYHVAKGCALHLWKESFEILKCLFPITMLSLDNFQIKFTWSCLINFIYLNLGKFCRGSGENNSILFCSINLFRNWN
jgi:hypothetical protein